MLLDATKRSGNSNLGYPRKSSEYAESLARFGGEPTFQTPAEFASHLKRELSAGGW
jgi:hypothetical protein